MGSEHCLRRMWKGGDAGGQNLGKIEDEAGVNQSILRWRADLD